MQRSLRSPGRPTAPLFRFPYGDRTSADIEVVNNAGYVPIRWTVDTLGWQGTSEGITTAIVRQRVLDAVRPGAIVLMHVGAHPKTARRSTPTRSRG
jgi:peptidoglycan-N-acetylglucosamine deacetylase